MPVAVVVGTQWGDEGKAKIIDLLAGSHSHVVRYQGGHNAGHTVVVGDQRYALQLVPSGVLYEHVTPVIGNGVVVDMPTLFNEIDVLEGRGVSCSRLKVSSLAQLIFPWHQAFDAVAENARGDAKIGTTLKGIGPAYADKALRVGIRAGDVRDADRFAALVRERATSALTMLKSVGGESFDVEEVVARFVVFGKRLVPYIANTVDMLHDAIEANKNVLLEGAQATFLKNKTLKTKNRAGQAFRMAAQSVKQADCPFGMLYRRLRSRLGPAQATVATAHAIARVVYRMLKYKVEYDPLSVNEYLRQYG